MRHLLALLVAFAVACSGSQPVPDVETTETRTTETTATTGDSGPDPAETREPDSAVVPTWLEGCWQYQEDDDSIMLECWKKEGPALDATVHRIDPANPSKVLEVTRRIQRDDKVMTYVETETASGTETIWRFVNQDEDSFEIQRDDEGMVIEYVRTGEGIEMKRSAGEEEELIVATRAAELTEEEKKKLASGEASTTLVRDVPGISVYSNPSNLSIYVNGTNSGRTTAATVETGPGTHDVQVECDSGLTEVKEVTLAAEERKKLFFRCETP